MKDYTVVFATILLIVSIFLIFSLGHFPKAYDPRYITAAMATGTCIVAYFIMTFCYRMAVALERLLWFLSGGEEELRAGLVGTMQSLVSQFRIIYKELGTYEHQKD